MAFGYRSDTLFNNDITTITRVERFGTWSIGILVGLLAFATLGSAIAALVAHEEPTTSPAALIVSASAFLIMFLLWVPKRYLARALDSSTMAGEATCSLSCLQITFVVLVGALVFKISRKTWWIDGAACIVLAILFGRESWKMLRWVSSPEFNGGCCNTCSTSTSQPATHPKPRASEPRALILEDMCCEDCEKDAEKAEYYLDLCECCFINDECRESDTCKCSMCNSSLASASTSPLVCFFSVKIN